LLTDKNRVSAGPNPEFPTSTSGKIFPRTERRTVTPFCRRSFPSYTNNTSFTPILNILLTRCQ